MTGAVAIWVKTPGLSPVKTRLAATIGIQAAEQFYRLSTQAVAAVVRETARAGILTPYWAVAEARALAHPAWQEFTTVFQGEGGLGSRLSHVYDALLEQHPWVIFIGGDAPQITADLLRDAVHLLESGEFVLGLAGDGGFYLFGGSRPVPRQAWEAVPYSDSRTARVLSDFLQPLAANRLPVLFDVDTAEELQQLGPTLASLPSLLAEQRAVLEWLNQRPTAAGQILAVNDR